VTVGSSDCAYNLPVRLSLSLSHVCPVSYDIHCVCECVCVEGVALFSRDTYSRLLSRHPTFAVKIIIKMICEFVHVVIKYRVCLKTV
jgi:hypothetical protein